MTLVVALVAAGCSVGQATPAPVAERPHLDRVAGGGVAVETTQSTQLATDAPSADSDRRHLGRLSWPPSRSACERRRRPCRARSASRSRPGDPRLFVIGQAGQIVIVSGGKVAGTFLDISARISCCGERGLLGLRSTRIRDRTAASSSATRIRAGDLRISEFHVGSDPDKADPASEKCC